MGIGENFLPFPPPTLSEFFVMCITIFLKRPFFFKNKDFLLCLLIPHRQLETAWGQTVRLRKRSEPGEMSAPQWSDFLGLGLGVGHAQSAAAGCPSRTSCQVRVGGEESQSNASPPHPQDARPKFGSPNSRMKWKNGYEDRSPKSVQL